MSRADGTVVKTVAFPGKLSESPVIYRKPPPALGEHTAEVLSEWGDMSEKDIGKLKKKKVV